MLQGLVFDFDGTIVDTETPEYESARAVWAHYGLQLDHGFWESHVGASNFDWLAQLATEVGEGFDAHEADRRRFEIHRVLIEKTSPNPGVVDLMVAAAERAIPVAIATNAPGVWPEHHLERMGIRHHVGPIISIDDVRRGKPHPDPFALACERIGADPRRCVAFEDSEIGVTSAVAAGLYVVAVPHHLSANHDVSPAHQVRETLAGLTIDELIEAVVAR